MAKVAKKYQDELGRLKKAVKETREYENDNYNHYTEFRNSIFKSSLTDYQRAVLQETGKPIIEFNTQEAVISRLRGEFAKCEPDIMASQAEGHKVDQKIVDFYEGYIRNQLFEAHKNNTQFDVYTDTLSGGFSAFKVLPDYANEMTFNQDVKFDRVYDPCLVGFDPMARYKHKADAQFCFELYPYRKDDFEREFDSVDIKDVKFMSSNSGYDWSYTDEKQQKIILVCDFYEKKKKKVKIHQLASGHTLTDDQYKQFIESWNSQMILRQAPAIINTRMTTMTTICRYRFIENQVLEYMETDWKYLPLVYADGNSVFLRSTPQSASKQMVRSYVYHLKGQQQLKNFSGQCLANELENTVQHKFMIPLEGIPDRKEYQEALTNVQKMQVVVFNSRDKQGQPLQPPIPVQRAAIPPEITSTFQLCDQLSQTILGAYDASENGLNQSQLSTQSVFEILTAGNVSAIPYTVGYIESLDQIAQIYVDLIPKYCLNMPRELPIRDKNGKKSTVKINQPDGIYLNHAPGAVQIKVEAGPSFGVQMSKALQQIEILMKASPTIAQFFGSPEGAPILFDNVQGRGIDQAKDMFPKFIAKQQQMAQQQQAQQITPAQVQMAKLKYQQTQDQFDNQLRAEQQTTDCIKVMGTLHNDQMANVVESQKADSENLRSLVSQAAQTEDVIHRRFMDAEDQTHRHAKETVETLHNINMDNQAAQQPPSAS